MMDWETIRVFGGAVISIFAIVNPVGGLPTYVGLTEDMEVHERRKVLRMAGVTALGIIVSMALVGQVLLDKVFGIGIAEFSFGGGLVLVVVGIQSLTQAPPSRREAHEIDPEARRSQHMRLAISPIAIPLLVGPGSIVNVMLIAGQHGRLFAVLACLLAFGAVIFLLNYTHIAYRLMRRGGAIAVGRVMTIFIIALGVKLCFSAMTAAFPALVGGGPATAPAP